MFKKLFSTPSKKCECLTKEDIDKQVKERFEKEVSFKKLRKYFGLDEENTSIEIYKEREMFSSRNKYIIKSSVYEINQVLRNDILYLKGIEKICSDGRIIYSVGEFKHD